MLAEELTTDFAEEGRLTPTFSPLFASSFWIGLIIAVSLAAVWVGIEPRVIMISAGVAIVPALLDIVLGRRELASDSSDIWVVFSWLGVALLGVWVAGAALSPLTILFALGPLHAFSVGRFRLGVEASVFAAIGFLGIAALDTLGYRADASAMLGNLPSLGALISTLQIGVFIAAARSNLKIQQADRKTLLDWQSTLWGVPVMVFNLDRNGQVRSWLGNRNVIGAPQDIKLARYGMVDMFTNTSDIRKLDGRPFRLKSVWDSQKPLEARLLRGPGGYRMIVSPVTEASLEAEALRAQQATAPSPTREQAQWVASVGHEIRNILNPVNGYTDLILSEHAGDIGERNQQFARNIKEGAEHLSLLIDDLMMASKSQAGHLNLTPELLDLRGEIEDTLRLVNWQATSANVTLSLAEGASPDVWADRKALRQIVMNLVTNAIKYSPENSQVTVQISETDGVARFGVIDEGEGMSADDLARIGEAFFQGENARGRTGTGLGLTIVNLLAEAMNGQFMIESELGKGTRAAVELPTEAPT